MSSTPKTINLTPSWAAALRIYGMAIENGTPDGVRSGHEGLQEAANHLDVSYPEKVQELKQALVNLSYAIAKGASFDDPDVQEALQESRELTGMTAQDEEAVSL